MQYNDCVISFQKCLSRWPAALIVLALLVGSPGVAGDLSGLLDRDSVRRAMDYLQRQEEETLQRQIRICQIPAPPFQEEARAAEFRLWLRELGLESVRIDLEGNVLGEIRGGSASPLIVLSAHLDTVYPPETDVAVERKGTILRGPGIVDDCRGLAVIWAVARAVKESQIRPRGTLVFAATVGEEGAGNLRGVRHLFASELRGKIDAFVSIDGAGSELIHQAVGSERYRVTFHGPGGHSYGTFGLPNPIHAMGRAIAKMAQFEVPAEPKVTFNVGLVQGGISVNSIPALSRMEVDMRSTDTAALASLVARFREAVATAVKEENARGKGDEKLTVNIDAIGLRPAGLQPLDSPIVQTALKAARAVGFQATPGAASTDANIPISLGIPAIAIDGGGAGQGAHSFVNEVFDSRNSHRGTQWALLLALALAGVE